MAGPNLRQEHPQVNWDEVARLYHALWYFGPAGVMPWETMHWMGVPVLKCPMDTWIYQEIIHRTRPEVIIETGTRFGGSALYMAHLLDLLGGDGRVISIDITMGLVHEPTKRHPRITLIEGSSTDSAIVNQVANAARGKRTMVVLDSDHAAAHVLREMELYSPLVTPGHYMIVEDSNVNGHPVIPNFGPGPMEAIEAFMKTPAAAGWRSDSNCERLLLTWNPRGYLLKS